MTATDDEVPSTHAPGLGTGKGRRAAPGWTNYQLSVILSLRPSTVSRWRSGTQYPDIGGLKKIEAVFGWPAREQIDLIPMSGYDLRWSLVFNEVLREWMIANPRTVSVDELVPVVRARKTGGGRPRKV
jgi:transcriptional regulator with XRE-family HTH domain